ncbi:PIN domain nuclease [Microbacterium sp. p3-SID336]|uniref:type II toxin-antitoxin system VapC family toxin n=1 Tax=Microbacterium sp. p3-SID336 TaxID=2916212 RepID=UPI0021A84FFD|nr:PIN domain nuclease [Microbacterium sp. p3-SID336]MCT1478423.1 PIN domain nuclease [Microbacterium sp. p3-SID336]
MILVDTSVWVGYLRGDATPAVERLEELIDRSAAIATTEPIVVELLAGATRPQELARVEALADGLPSIPVDAVTDYRDAGQLYRSSALNGHPIRSMLDCVIAAVAIRRDLPLLHQDRDFAFLAEISPLRDELTG